jgi:hypothetical protein
MAGELQSTCPPSYQYIAGTSGVLHPVRVLTCHAALPAHLCTSARTRQCATASVCAHVPCCAMCKFADGKKSLKPSFRSARMVQHLVQLLLLVRALVVVMQQLAPADRHLKRAKHQQSRRSSSRRRSPHQFPRHCPGRRRLRAQGTQRLWCMIWFAMVQHHLGWPRAICATASPIPAT